MKRHTRPGAAARFCLAAGALVAATSAVVVTQTARPPLVAPAGANTRIPEAEIHKHVDRAWFKDALTTGLLDYWVKHSVEPNGFIQENLDRNWKPWGTQREASLNGQGRQLYSMAIGYELTRSKEYRDALTR